MAQLLEAPTEGYEDAIVIPEITANNFEIKHGLLNLVQNKQFFGNDKEDPHAHIRYFNKITSTMKIPNVPNTHGFNEITRFQQKFDETFYEAWDRFNDLLRGHSYQNCPATNSNIYHDNIQEYVSQAAAANFNQANSGYRPPMVSNQIRPPGFPPIQNPHANSQNNFNRGNNFNQNRGNNFNQGQIYRPPINQPVAHQGPAPQTHGVSKTDFERYVTANDAVLRNMQNQGQNLQSQMANLTDMLSKFVTANTASTSGSGTLPGNTVTNPKEDLKGITTRSGVTIQGPKAVNHDAEVTKDTMPPANNGSTEDVQPPVVQIQSRNPNPEP
ncbi:hypothetical protein Tco_0854082, partial [Tanacetum coccineum]